jgi:hypothetical protein
MASGDFIQIEGYTDFMRGLKDAPRKIQLAARRSIRKSAGRVVTRAAVYAPRKTGNLAGHTTIRVTEKRITIDWNEPYAGVQEWGRTYLRASRGTAGPAPRGTKKKTFSDQGHVGEGYHEVHMTGAAPPRFAFKARDELADEIGQELIDAVEQVLIDTGYWKVA